MRKPEMWPLMRLGPFLAFGPVGQALSWAWPFMPNAVQNFAWASLVPYLWGFTAGAVIADLASTTSLIRGGIAWWFRYFDVPQVLPVHSLSDGVEAVEPTASIVFVRKAKNASVVVEIDGCMTTDGNLRQPTSFVSESDRTFAVGERYKLPLAFIPLKTFPQGPLPPARYSSSSSVGSPYLVADSVNVLTIVLRSGWRCQKYKIHVRSLMKDSATHARFFWMVEDYDPFKDGNTAQSFT